MAVQSKQHYDQAFKLVDPEVPQLPPSSTPTHDCGWCGQRAAFATDSLCPNCENDDEALAAFSIFLSWQDENPLELNFESEGEVEEEDVEVFNCMLCGAMTNNLTTHSRVVNGEWVTEHLPFCNAMHHAIYSLNLG